MTNVRYNPASMELAVNPGYSDSEAFAALAAEIAQARFHDKGRNPDYSREHCELSAQSVSYILCRRFGIERELPICLPSFMRTGRSRSGRRC